MSGGRPGSAGVPVVVGLVRFGGVGWGARVRALPERRAA